MDLNMNIDDALFDNNKIFRQLLKAMSEPGYIIELLKEKNPGEETLNQELFPTTWLIAKNLFDADCQVYISTQLKSLNLAQSMCFHTDCSVIDDISKADFAILTIDELSKLDQFKSGSTEKPHESCTLIVQSEVIDNEIKSNKIGSKTKTLSLTGPGIKTKRNLFLSGLSEEIINKLQNNHNHYPCGVDIFFCSATQITALPRSTTITTFEPQLESA